MGTLSTPPEQYTSMSETRFGAKACTVKFKTDDLAEGEFIAYASIFDTKDSDGDVVVKDRKSVV